MPKTIVDVFVLNSDYVKKHPEVPAKMTKCWNEAIAWYEKNPDKGNEIMAKAMGLEIGEMADMASGVTFIGQADNKAFFDKSKPNNIFEVAERAISFWKSKGIITRDVSVDALISAEYVNAE
jgi:NitT/TauT family transport system substrate-binding protein